MAEAGPRLFWSDFVYEMAGWLQAQAPPSRLYLVGGAVRAYADAVRDGVFPGTEHSFA